MSENEVDTAVDIPEDTEKAAMIGYFLEQIRLRTVTNKALVDKIMRQREQLRALNNALSRRKYANRRLREYVDAVKQLHRPTDGRNLEHTVCRTDGEPWPCRTNKAVLTVWFENMPEGVVLSAKLRAAEGDSNGE